MIKRITNVVEFDAMHQLSCYAFDVQHTSEEKEAFFDYCHHTLNYGDWINRELVSKVMVVPFFINLYGKRVKMGGLVTSLLIQKIVGKEAFVACLIVSLKKCKRLRYCFLI